MCGGYGERGLLGNHVFFRRHGSQLKGSSDIRIHQRERTCVVIDGRMGEGLRWFIHTFTVS